ncbi:retinitis pigmentosa gtpase regulator a-related [Anaeramoeba flamelloides]|uniref:Retinitis pigmentosa gtpase regulator a-related n=1 Tax=Anaeramoeba flamelloides TaxID=1746091 RepID=A0AAV7ZTV2_9EUKA|nr:retinitis pigmentosa gtpase regulator a-related [Anaeramoeba flamelloides]
MDQPLLNKEESSDLEKEQSQGSEEFVMNFEEAMKGYDLRDNVKTQKQYIREQANLHYISKLFHRFDKNRILHKIPFFRSSSLSKKEFGISLSFHFRWIIHIFCLFLGFSAFAIYMLTIFWKENKNVDFFKRFASSQSIFNNYYTYLIIELGFYVWVVIWSYLSRTSMYYQTAKAKSKKKTLNANDFTIEAKNLPSNISKQEIFEFFSQFGEIVYINRLLKNSKLLKTYSTYLQLKTQRNNLHPDTQYRDRKNLNVKILKCIKKLESYSNGKANLKTNKKMCFITYKRASDAYKCVNKLSRTGIQKCCSVMFCNVFFTHPMWKGNRFTVRRANDVRDYIPRNLNNSSFFIFVRGMILTGVSLPLIILSTYFTSVLKKTNHSYLSGVTIFVMNEIVYLIVDTVMKLRGDVRNTQNEAYRMRITLVIDGLSFYLPLLWNYRLTAFYSEVANIILVKSLLVAFASQIKIVLLPTIQNKIKQYLGRRSKNVSAMFNAYTPKELFLHRFYLNILRIVCYTIIFYTLYPLVAVICTISILINWWSHKYVILRQYKKPRIFSDEILFTAYTAISDMVVYHIIITEIFVINSLQNLKQKNYGWELLFTLLLFVVAFMAFFFLKISWTILLWLFDRQWVKRSQKNEKDYNQYAFGDAYHFVNPLESMDLIQDLNNWKNFLLNDNRIDPIQNSIELNNDDVDEMSINSNVNDDDNDNDNGNDLLSSDIDELDIRNTKKKTFQHQTFENNYEFNDEKGKEGEREEKEREEEEEEEEEGKESEKEKEQEKENIQEKNYSKVEKKNENIAQINSIKNDRDEISLNGDEKEPEEEESGHEREKEKEKENTKERVKKENILQINSTKNDRDGISLNKDEKKPEEEFEEEKKKEKEKEKEKEKRNDKKEREKIDSGSEKEDFNKDEKEKEGERINEMIKKTENIEQIHSTDNDKGEIKLNKGENQENN